MSSSETYGPVGVGGVDEVDAELGQAPQDGEGLVAVLGRTPDAVAGDAHRAVAEAGDLEVAADLEGAGGGRSSCHGNDLPADARAYRPAWVAGRHLRPPRRSGARR